MLRSSLKSKSKPTIIEYEDLTMCGICLSTIEDPKALPCLHSFCLKCLRNISDIKAGMVICPLCKEATAIPPEGVTGFRDNFFIIKLKERRSIHKSQDKKMTCVCCVMPACNIVARCIHCNGFLCQSCVNLHGTLSPLKPHTLIALDQLQYVKLDIGSKVKDECCKKHKDQALRWYCTKCEIPICRDCTVMEHRHSQHDYVSIESVHKGQLEDIKKLEMVCEGIVQHVDAAIEDVEKVKLSLESALELANRKLEESADTARQQFLKLLETNHKIASEKLRAIETERFDKIDDCKSNLKNLQAKLYNALEMANQVIRSGSQHDVAANYATLTSTLKQLQDVRPVPIRKSLSKVTFRPNNRKIVQEIDLGVVVEGTGIKKGKWVLEKQVGKHGQGKLTSAWGVAAGRYGDIVVTCYNGSQVKIYNSSGDYKLSLDTKQGLLLGKSSYPSNAVVTSDGHYYLTDQTAYVKVYSSDGKYMKEFPSKSPNNTSSDIDDASLYGLALDKEGYLLIGSNQKYISKHKQDGTHVCTLKVDIPPWFIAVGSENIIISTNLKNAGVLVLDNDGNLIRSLNAPKHAKSWHPLGICCSEDDIVYISSYDAHDKGGIYTFTVDGEYLGCVTMDVSHAEGLALIGADENRLAVAQYGHPVKIFCLK
ncbi:uncharacterized protein [Amphiura filiformis]|uniref:uncharacterized protein n=1 Tax=Amphiura filiformis TaxID=82378 RepID=UPI003B211DC7